MNRAAVLFLAVFLGCSSDHSTPSRSEISTEHEEIVSWFAERGVQIELPMPLSRSKPVAAADSVASTDSTEVGVIGDIDGSGEVDYWDVWLLWHHLIGTPVSPGSILDTFSDIDQDGEVGWMDLAHLGEALYGTENPYHVGFPFGGMVVAESAFNIEVVYLEGARLPLTQRPIIQQAVDTWETIITGDIPDHDFSKNPYDSNNEWFWSWMTDNARGAERIVQVDQVDDLRLLVSTSDEMWSWVIAQAVMLVTREDSKLPALCLLIFNEDSFESDEYVAETDLYSVALHEIAHALGFGTVWEEADLLDDIYTYRNRDADTHFTGELAISAFDAAGGQDYSGNKVPVETSDDAHWRESIMGDEIMGPQFNGFESLSAITLQSFADLGYEVDVQQAEPYVLSRRARSKEPASPTMSGCRVINLASTDAQGGRPSPGGW